MYSDQHGSEDFSIHDLQVQDSLGDGQKNKPFTRGGTAADAADMNRMGRKQELERNFKFVSIVGFVTILQATWEWTLISNYPGLLNGGTAGIIWSTIVVCLFMIAIMASIAEMASMAPNSGGQYHWTSEFAPPGFQRPLSYVVGWASTIGWIAGVPSCSLQLAGIIQQMVAVSNPDTTFVEPWKVTLLLFAMVFLTVGFNIFGAHHLPLAEGVILFLHIFAFFAFLLTFWIMGDLAPASQVFGDFYNGGGWSSTGLSCLIGLTSPIWCFIGPDAGAHMSEELKDASIQLPKAMMWSVVLNGFMGISMLITFCFCIGNVEDFVHSGNSYPIILVIHNATGSFAATCILGTVLIILLFFSSVSLVASSSRQIWSFARNHGFPGSKWIREVSPRWQVPVNALLVTLIVSLILGAINFGSETALNAILSVSNAALLLSYIISIGALRLRRLRGEPLLPRRWSLGRWGGVTNDIALVFLIVAFFFSFWPSHVLTGSSDAAVDFNWAIVVLVAIGILALVYYLLGGRHKYIAPVALVKNE